MYIRFLVQLTANFLVCFVITNLTRFSNYLSVKRYCDPSRLLVRSFMFVREFVSISLAWERRHDQRRSGAAGARAHVHEHRTEACALPDVYTSGGERCSRKCLRSRGYFQRERLGTAFPKLFWQWERRSQERRSQERNSPLVIYYILWTRRNLGLIRYAFYN